MCKQLFLALLSLVVSSCTVIDYSHIARPPIPKDLWEYHYVEQGRVYQVCSQYGMFPEACMEWGKGDGKCHIWLPLEASKWMIDHEEAHCMGYNHLGAQHE